MNATMEQSENSCILNFGGELTIQSGNELKEVLINLLDSSENLSLNIEKVTEIDIACLQILCSAHKASFKSNKYLKVSGKISEGFRESIQRCGYLNNKGCIAGTNETCLWVKGGKQ